jgi:hypothetical protein
MSSEDAVMPPAISGQALQAMGVVDSGAFQSLSPNKVIMEYYTDSSVLVLTYCLGLGTERRRFSSFGRSDYGGQVKYISSKARGVLFIDERRSQA